MTSFAPFLLTLSSTNISSAPHLPYLTVMWQCNSSSTHSTHLFRPRPQHISLWLDHSWCSARHKRPHSRTTVPLPIVVPVQILAVIHAVQPFRILWWNRSRALLLTSMSTECTHNLVFLFSLVINLVVFQGSSVEMVTRSTITCWNGIYYVIIFGECMGK